MKVKNTYILDTFSPTTLFELENGKWYIKTDGIDGFFSPESKFVTEDEAKDVLEYG